MDELRIEMNADGAKNTILHVSGILTEDLPQTDIVSFSMLAGNPKKLKIEAFVFAIQEKMGFYLWWRSGNDYTLILPLESRGGLGFEGMQCLHSPAGAEAIAASSFNWAAPGKAFLLMLDITKQ